MIVQESIKSTTSILQKANDFKYFALLGSFVLILDTTLVTYYGVALVDLSFEMIKKDFSVGSVLMFFALFSLFISFVVGVVRYILMGIFHLIPYKLLSLFFKDNSYGELDTKHYLTDSELRRYAIKNNNNVAYSVYIDWQGEKKSEALLEQYSLAFLIASILNFSVWFVSDRIILSFLVTLDYKASTFSIDSLVFLLTLLLYLGFLYFGVVRGCGLALKDRARIFIYNHGIET